MSGFGVMMMAPAGRAAGFSGFLFLSLLLLASPPPAPAGPVTSSSLFAIRVVDEATSRGIPAVRLQTTHAAEYWTDNAGMAAFCEPDLMNTPVHFRVESHGYSVPRDGFGYPTVVLSPTPGGSATVSMKRDNIAERLYRMTGAGLYRESDLLGLPHPAVQEPGAVPPVGQDGGDAVIYGGRLYWFWGDSLIPRYPLGVFKSVCATSELPSWGGLDPETGIAFRYLRLPDGDLRPIINMPGQVYWYTFLRTVSDTNGRERLLSDYVQIEGYMKAVERGLLEFNDDTGYLEFVRRYPEDAVIPFSIYEGPAFRHSDGGKEWLYHPSPYPSIRSPADYESQRNLSGREAFTCLKQGARFDGSPEQLDRDPSGRLRWSWKGETSPVGEKEMDQLITSGTLRPEEAWYAVRDVLTGKRVRSHNGSIYWNEYRGRWVCLRLESGGDTPVGEVWYLEGDTPMGPWVYARKIVTHAWPGHRYSFYGVAQIPAFDTDNGRVLLFKGSASAEFGDSHAPMPRHNYNNFMYRLELDDPRLALPVPVYRTAGSPGRYRTRTELGSSSPAPGIGWYALDRPGEGAVPVYEIEAPEGGTVRLSLAPPAGRESRCAFYALPADADPAAGTPASQTVPLFERSDADSGSWSYSAAPEGKTSGTVVCRVWPAPITFTPLAALE